MPLHSPATIHALLVEHGLQPRKSLGQHFLADPNTARRITRLADVHAGDSVLEIGPGLGSLTLALIEQGAAVLAVELDETLAAVLRTVVAGAAPPVEVRVADACAIEWDAVLGSSRRWKCVSNLPYNVAVPVVMRLLEDAPTVEQILVMVQREVGERIAAGVGDEQYGAVSVRVAYRAEAAVVGRVPPTVFVPPPNVESVLVALTRRPTPPVEVPSEDAMFTLVRAGFGQRRKMLRRALQPVLGPETTRVLEAAGIAPTARAETLDLDQWAALARASVAA